MSKTSNTDGARANYGELTIDDIVDTAGKIVRREGVNALTMRRLASEMSVSPMAPYHYVNGKPELLRLLIARMQSDIHAADGPTWREQVRGTYKNSYEACRKYGGLVLEAQIVGQRDKQAKRVTDEMTELLEDAGLQHDEARVVELAFSHFLIGFLTWELELEKNGTKTRRPIPEYFEDGIELLLDGIEERLKKKR